MPQDVSVGHGDGDANGGQENEPARHAGGNVAVMVDDEAVDAPGTSVAPG